MLDNLREDAASSFDEDKPKKAAPQYEAPSYEEEKVVAVRPSRFLGMSGMQRFVISVMLFLTVCIIGTMFLLVMGKIGF